MINWFNDPVKEFKSVVWGKCVCVCVCNTFIVDVHLTLTGNKRCET